MKKITGLSAKGRKAKVEDKSERPSMIRAAYYIRDDQDTLLEKIKIAIRERAGERRDKSDLIREAIDDLAAKYGVK